MSEITEKSQQQLEGINQINKALAAMEATIQSTAASAAQLAEGASQFVTGRALRTSMGGGCAQPSWTASPAL